VSELSFAQIEQLWITNGGNPAWAPLAAGIAIAESGGNTTAWNQNASTGDDSVGLWQINYFGNLSGPRTAAYGAPSALAADPNAQAKAAISLSGNGTNWDPWKTDRTWDAWEAAGAPADPSAATVESWLSAGGIGGGATAGAGTAVLTSATTASPVLGIPNEMPQNPGLGGSSLLNPFGALSAQVQWLGEWIGWAFFITIIFILGAAIMLLGFVMLLSILLGPAVGPVVAGVGKGPSGWVLGAVKDIGANREDGQTRNARRQLASQGGSNRRSDYVAAQRSAPGPGRTRPLRPSGGSTSSDF
jgi:hypothetical protein